MIRDREGDAYREEPGRYRGGLCHQCYGTIWRAIVNEQTGWRKLRCTGCGHIRSFPRASRTLTFEKEAA